MGYKHSKRKDGRYKVVFHGKQFYGKTLAEARAKRDKFVRLVEEGLQTTQETVAEYAPKWLERTKIGIKPHTYNGYAKMLDDMNEVIGNLYLDEVKPQHIKTVYAKKFAGRSGSHIRHAKNLYTGMFEAALEDGYIRFNPCRSKSAQPHKGVDGTHREITDEERYYIETTEHRLRPLLNLMLYAGLRNEEAIPFDVDKDVDFNKKIIKVQRFRHIENSQVIIDGKGKTKLAKRDIKLFPQLEAVLKGLHGPIITMHDGLPLSDHGWRSVWATYVRTVERRMNGCQKRWYGRRKKDLARKAEYDRLMAEGKRDEAKEYELPPWKSFTVTPYDLRHSFCTYCRDLGIDMLVCMKWMGHSDSKMILEIYDHVSDRRIEQEYQKILDDYDRKKEV
ncbi:MAG: tyrosine-type recombinase/integrase [Treponema sp.]|nr:tyrosine-type recombinase/integrase [Treponema sp.]